MRKLQQRLTTAIAERDRTQDSDLPVRVPRDQAAELVTRHFFKISRRTLERWPLTWRRINGRAHCEVSELLDVAGRMLAAAPPVMSGRRTDQPNA
jgi:hypothetical protein